MPKNFMYRGRSVDDLKAMSMDEFINLLPSRMRRSLRRGLSNEQRIVLERLRQDNGKPIKTHARDMVVLPEMIGKIELRDIPVLRLLAGLIGVIWVHRGQPDRGAISAVLEAFRHGRKTIIAPEGRESVSGALEVGADGAAFLALKSGVLVVPVTMTGSEFRRIENNLKKMRRTPVTIRVGQPFVLSLNGRRQDTLQEGTRIIMESLARQLPPEYRGVYADLPVAAQNHLEFC